MDSIQPIPDHIALNMKLMFVGYNPSIRSGETGHHYANARNRFWTILEQSGITERRYSADEDQDLLAQGIGFTNIVPRPTRTAAEITSEEYAEGSRELRRKIELFRPERVCFVGKGVYEAFSGNRHAAWGFQPDSVVAGVKEFVAPSSSGLVRMKLEDVISIYKELAQDLRHNK